MPTSTPWPELQPLAERVAVGELDGEAAIAAIIDAIVARELATHGGGAALAPAVRAAAERAVRADRVLVAMLRPIAPLPEPAPPSRQPPPRTRARVAAALDDEGPAGAIEADFARRQGGRRLTAVAGIVVGVVAGGLGWWFVLRETPCERFAKQVCVELAEPCRASEVETHLATRSIDAAACEAAGAAAEAAAAAAGHSKRRHAYEVAVIAALGFDPRTGVAPEPAAVAERGPVAPIMLARKLPSLPSLAADEAHLYVSSGEAVLRLRSTGGQFETLAAAPGGHGVVPTADFVYWAARGADGNEALWVDRKRGEYEPTAVVTAPARLGASHCMQGACAYVDLTDGAVWIATHDGPPPKKLTGAQNPAPTELWIDDREVAWLVPGTPATVVAVAVDGGTPRIVAGAESAPSGLQGDAEGWLWIAGGALRTVPRAGGDVVTLVPSGVSVFALDRLRVLVGDATAGTIAAVPRTGGPSTPIVGDQPGLERLVADPAAVFWTRGGELFRLPK